jgi:multidrug efflux system membrane fusion protein
MKRFWCGSAWIVLVLVSGALGAAEYPARIQWAERLTLSTPQSGVVTRVAVEPGQRVARGDLLVELDPRVPTARLKRAEAVLTQARQDHEEARRELERTQELFDRTLLSVHDLQLAQVAAAGAAARLGQAEAEQVQARVALERSRLAAPYDAVVVAVPVNVGQTVINRFQAQPLVVLAPAGRMRAQALLETRQLDALPLGTAVRVRMDDQSYDGTVAEVGLEPDGEPSRSARYPLTVSFALPKDRLLRPGQAAMIETR